MYRVQIVVLVLHDLHDTFIQRPVLGTLCQIQVVTTGMPCKFIDFTLGESNLLRHFRPTYIHQTEALILRNSVFEE